MNEEQGSLAEAFTRLFDAILNVRQAVLDAVDSLLSVRPDRLSDAIVAACQQLNGNIKAQNKAQARRSWRYEQSIKPGHVLMMDKRSRIYRCRNTI